MSLLVEDRALREAFRRGEHEALRAVYREYAPALFAFLTRGFSGPATGRGLFFKGYREAWELESAVYEVFAKAFLPRAREAYDGLRPYRSYLFTIARNTVIDRHRRRGKEELLEDPSAVEAHAAEPDAPQPAADNPEEEALARELSVHVKGFVSTLAEEERQLFALRFGEGQSVEQISRGLGVSEHRVKRFEKRVRKRFFNAMKKHGYFDQYRFGADGLERIFILTLTLAVGGRA